MVDLGVNAQEKNGVVDLVAENEGEVTVRVRKLAGYIQGNQSSWSNPDHRSPYRILSQMTDAKPT